MTKIFGFNRPQPFYESNPAGGEPVQEKMVPERDLLAVKAARDRDVAALQAKLDDAVRSGNSSLARIQELEAQANLVPDLQTQLEAANSQVAATEESRRGLEGRLLGTVRDSLLKLGVPEDRLADKTLDQLELIQQTVGGLDLGAASGRFDRGGGGNGSPLPATGRGKILAGIEAGELQRVQGGSNGPVN